MSGRTDISPQIAWILPFIRRPQFPSPYHPYSQTPDADVQRIRNENLTPQEQYKKLVHAVAIEVLGEKDHGNIAARLDDFVQECWGFKASDRKVRKARYRKERLMRDGTHIPGDTDNSEEDEGDLSTEEADSEVGSRLEEYTDEESASEDEGEDGAEEVNGDDLLRIFRDVETQRPILESAPVEGLTLTEFIGREVIKNRMVHEFDLSGDGQTLLRSMAPESIDIFRGQYNEAKEAALAREEAGANQANGGNALSSYYRRSGYSPSPPRRSSEPTPKRKRSGSIPSQKSIKVLRPTVSVPLERPSNVPGSLSEMRAPWLEPANRIQVVRNPPRHPSWQIVPSTTTRRKLDRESLRRILEDYRATARSQGFSLVESRISRITQSLDRLPGGFRTQASLIEAFTSPWENMEKKREKNRRRIHAQQARVRQWQDQTTCFCHQAKTCPDKKSSNQASGAEQPLRPPPVPGSLGGSALRPTDPRLINARAADLEFYRREDENLIKAALEKWLVKIRSCLDDPTLDDPDVRNDLKIRFWMGLCLLSRTFPSRMLPNPPFGITRHELDALATSDERAGEECSLAEFTTAIELGGGRHLVFDPWTKQGFHEYHKGTSLARTHFLPHPLPTLIMTSFTNL